MAETSKEQRRALEKEIKKKAKEDNKI